jgi:hypothetical protein
MQDFEMRQPIGGGIISAPDQYDVYKAHPDHERDDRPAHDFVLDEQFLSPNPPPHNPDQNGGEGKYGTPPRDE